MRGKESKEMLLLEICNKSSIAAYEKELERQKNLDGKTDLLFKWLTLLIAVFSFLVSLISGKNLADLSDYVFLILYVLMMVFFIVALIIILIINFPVKRKLPGLGSEKLQLIQKKGCQGEYSDTHAYWDVLYEEILENDIMTRKLRDHNQRVAMAIIIADIFMILGLITATAVLGYGMWKG